MTVQYKHTLSPIKIRGLTVANRIVLGPHSYGHIDSSALPTDQLVAYVAERAKGGAGLIILGGTGISRDGALGDIVLNLDDGIIPKYQKISEEVHKFGAKIFDQLMHAGGLRGAREGRRVVAPSRVPHQRTRTVPSELSQADIRGIVQAFSDAAYRAEQGGLDGVEIKCDQGFLLHEFLSPYYNRRNDTYGGAVENRLRIIQEIISLIRGKVSDSFVVGIRIPAHTFMEGDITLRDMKDIVAHLSSSGIDYVNVNGGTNSTFRGYLIGHGDSSIESNNFAKLSKEIKSVTSLPVIAGSMILHPEDAESIIASGSADLVAMTRAQIADPEIVNKIKRGDVEHIRPCILSNQGCVGNHFEGYGVRCIHNPAASRENELGIGTIVPTQNPQRIAVIGGGVAGMEFARVAALRGHKISIFEKERQVGGQLILAGAIPYRQGLLEIPKHLEREIKLLKVNIHLGVEITIAHAEDLLEDYDAIVVATGSQSAIPDNYSHLPECYSISQVIRQPDLLKKNIIVVEHDWRMNALGFSEWLLHQGKSVTLLSTYFYVGEGMDIVSLTSYYSRLDQNIRLLPLSELQDFNGKEATIRNVASNRSMSISPIDQVIFVSGSKPEAFLYKKLIEKYSNISAIGDCNVALGIPEAMLEANRLARNIY